MYLICGWFILWFWAMAGKRFLFSLHLSPPLIFFEQNLEHSPIFWLKIHCFSPYSASFVSNSLQPQTQRLSVFSTKVIINYIVIKEWVWFISLNLKEWLMGILSPSIFTKQYIELVHGTCASPGCKDLILQFSLKLFPFWSVTAKQLISQLFWLFFFLMKFL